jgi:hypothetical protein
MIIIYRNTDDSIEISNLSSLAFVSNTTFYLTVKKDYDDINVNANIDLDTTAVLEKKVTTTINNQNSVLFVIDHDTDYSNIEYNKIYRMGILVKNTSTNPNEKFTHLTLDDDRIIFKKTVKNSRPNN